MSEGTRGTFRPTITNLPTTQGQQTSDLGMTKDFAGHIVQKHGRYADATLNGRVFTTSNAAVGITIASTHVSPIASNTGKGIIVVANPSNSTKNLVLLKATVSQISGTPGGGLVLNLIKTANTITATPSGVVNNNSIGNTTATAATVFNDTALTNSVLAIMLRPLFSQSAIALGVSGSIAEVDLGGDIVVIPGNAIAIAATATGTSHVVACSLTWEEVDL